VEKERQQKESQLKEERDTVLMIDWHDFKVLHRNVQRFRGGLVFKDHRLLYHSTLGLRVVKKKMTSR